jgi:large subunit ribosomal protein L23
MKSSFDVIKAPLVTEKSNALAAENKYAFKVDVNAEKIEIGKAVEELFNVKVKSVNVMNYSGKAKRAGRSNKMGHRADWKKAVVTLAEGTIEII